MNNTLSINWEITKKCNLNCIYCRVCGGEEKEDELTEEEAKLVINKLSSAGFRHLKFTGGEPLIKTYFWDLVNYAHRKNMLISIFTNGTQISDTVLPKFKKYISVVAISLDTLIDEHNIVLKRHKSELIINSIKKLQHLDIPVVISATVTKITLDDLPGLIAFAKKARVAEIKINDFVPNGRANDNLNLLKLTKPLANSMSKITKQIEKTFKETIKTQNQFQCECSDNDLFISYKGNLYPCVELSYVSEDFCLGNIVHHSLSDLLTLNNRFYSQIKKTDYCGYCYMSSQHFSACLNHASCPKALHQYMKNAKA